MGELISAPNRNKYKSSKLLSLYELSFNEAINIIYLFMKQIKEK